MHRTATLATAVAVAALVAPSLSGAGPTSLGHRLSATMTSRQVVTVRNRPAKFPQSVLTTARGTFSGRTSADGKSLSWHISYRNLANPKIVIADIHIGPPGRFGAILLRLCGPCKAGQSGTKKLKAGIAQRLVTGDHWVTLITDRYPNGIVRGQIRVE